MKFPIQTIVESVQIAREAFASVKRNDATDTQHELVKQLTEAKVDGLIADIDTGIAGNKAAAAAKEKDQPKKA